MRPRQATAFTLAMTLAATLGAAGTGTGHADEPALAGVAALVAEAQQAADQAAGGATAAGAPVGEAAADAVNQAAHAIADAIALLNHYYIEYPVPLCATAFLQASVQHALDARMAGEAALWDAADYGVRHVVAVVADYPYIFNRVLPRDLPEAVAGTGEAAARAGRDAVERQAQATAALLGC